MKDPQKSVKSTSPVDKRTGRLSDEKLAAMKERARKWKPANTAGGEADVLAKIAEMAEPDRGMAERIHAIVKASAPALSPRTWYGSPAYARDGNVICFFWPRAKFQGEVRDARLQRQGTRRRRHDVAELIRSDGADRGR